MLEGRTVEGGGEPGNRSNLNPRAGQKLVTSRIQRTGITSSIKTYITERDVRGLRRQKNQKPDVDDKVRRANEKSGTHAKVRLIKNDRSFEIGMSKTINSMKNRFFFLK